MKLKALCAVAALIIAAQAQAKIFGGHDGNGGGGFCTEGVCKTAAEAGIKIKSDSQNPNYWVFPADVIQQTENIITALPFGRDVIKNRTFATPSTFVLANEVDSRAMKRIKKNYEEVMEKNGFTKPLGELEIFAISDSQYTYLLPSFFRLNSRQKALILIHEGNIREGLSLAKTLELDGLLLSYLNDHQGNSFDLPRFLGSLYSAAYSIHDRRNVDAEAEMSAALLEYIMRRSGRSLSVANFRDNDSDNISFSKPESISDTGRLAVAKSASVFGLRFSKMFANADVQVRGAIKSSYSSGDSTVTVIESYKVEATKVCRGLDSKAGWEQFPLVIIKSTLLMVDCRRKQKDGTYSALEFILGNIDLGNIQE